MTDRSVTWYVEPYVFSLSEDLEPLKAEILKQGHRVEAVRYLPFVTEELGKKPGEQRADGPGVFYGSLNMAKFIQRSVPAETRPAVYCTLRNYDCSRYYAYLGKYLLNGRYAMVPFAELERNRGFLFGALGCEDAVFVRPDGGDKRFTGQLLYLESFDRDYERMGAYDVSADTLVVVSEPRNLTGEWRFVVVEGKVVAGSAYKKSDEVIPDAARALADEVAQEYEPDKCWTLDVCRTKEGEYFLLEIGSFSCAGLYRCDVEPIVREVSRVVYEEWADVGE